MKRFLSWLIVCGGSWLFMVISDFISQVAQYAASEIGGINSFILRVICFLAVVPFSCAVLTTAALFASGGLFVLSESVSPSVTKLRYRIPCFFMFGYAALGAILLLAGTARVGDLAGAYTVAAFAFCMLLNIKDTAPEYNTTAYRMIIPVLSAVISFLVLIFLGFLAA